MSIRSVLALSFLTFTPLQATIIHQVDPVLVTATRTEKSMLEVPASLSVVDTKKLERYAPQSLTETLKDVPNVSFEGGPRRTAAEVNIRGFGPGRVVMKMDGVRQNFESGHRGQIFIDPDLLKQVDIVRGPQSTLHGSGALGGIVGFFTKDARDMLKQNEKWGGFAKTGYGTRSDETFQTASAFGRYEETADGLVYITKRQHNDLRAPHGQRIMYSKDDTLSGLAKGNLYLGEFHTLKGAAHHFYDDHKIPASPQLAAGNRNRLVHRFTNQSQYQLGYAYDNEDQKWIKLKANASLNHTHIFEKGIDSTTTLNPRDRTDYTTYGFDIANTTAVDICPEISAESTYGLEFYRDEQSSRRNGVERGAFPKASSQVFSLFGEKDLNITKYVTLTPGIRWDHFRLRGNRVNLTRNYNRALPKGIITLKPMEQIRIYGLYAEGYRVPTLSELFSNGIHFNGLSRGPRVIFPSNFFVPNLNLKPESNKTFEAGINAGFDDVLCKDDRLVTKVSGFVTHSRNFIDMIVDRKGGTTTRINVAKTRVKGFEA